jgi:1-deoxy-D-xylulose-5-phosphate synthase
MPTGSSLKLMMDVLPARAFDVGIAEQHAVTLSAGMATQGMVVFCNIYSTFLQRAFDQIIHDVALQNLPVIFCLDRAGLVGEDGATHHGVFDIAYLRLIPNLIIFAPLNEIELQNIMYTASLGLKNPIAIRYPRGRGQFVNWKDKYFGQYDKLNIGQAKCLGSGSNAAILSTGTIGNNVCLALDHIKNENDFAHYHFGFIKPLDETMLHDICKKYAKIFTIEDGTIVGGFGAAVQNFVLENEYKIIVKTLGIPDHFIEHGTVDELQKMCGIDVESLIERFKNLKI